VRQYRPAVERFTWELPAGLVENGESPESPAAAEETGFVPRTVQALGAHAPCTARLSNRIHSFFAETSEREKAWHPEVGIEVKLVTPAELGDLILSDGFAQRQRPLNLRCQLPRQCYTAPTTDTHDRQTSRPPAAHSIANYEREPDLIDHPNAMLPATRAATAT
jgi:8-oxo-dGTP pyrophosphatase MutT (NUDIX family)